MTKEILIENYPSTFNKEIPITCADIPNDKVEATCANLRKIFYELGRIFELSSLKGISIALGEDAYKHAIELIDENRKASEGEVIGCAMTITNFSDDELESYIVLRDIVIIPLLVEEKKDDEQLIGFMLQTIAHECGHIHSDTLLYNASIKLPATNDYKNHYEQVICEVSLAGWSEFSACYYSAHIGMDPKQDFKDIIIGKLETIEGELKSAKSLSNDPQLMLFSVTKHIGNLIKYSSYYIGCMLNRGFDTKLEDTLLFKDIENSWYSEFLNELVDVYKFILINLSSDKPKPDEILKVGQIFIGICEHFKFELTLRDNKTYFYDIVA